MIDELVDKVIGAVQQDASYKLQDMLEEYSPINKLFAIAAIKSNIDALILSLDEPERTLINEIVIRTQVTIMPPEYDPRRQGRQK